MKSAQEILLDGEIARRAENEREKRWANALAARRAAIWPHIISIVVWPVLAVAVLSQDRTVKFQPVFFLAPVFFFGAGLLLWRNRPISRGLYKKAKGLASPD